MGRDAIAEVWGLSPNAVVSDPSVPDDDVDVKR